MNIQKCLLDTNNDILLPKGILSTQLKDSKRNNVWGSRASKIDTIIIHYMSAVEIVNDNPFSLKECLQIFIDFDVSSHYLIDRNGTIFNLVPEESKAWHAGGSIMPEPDNRDGVNDFSIGIELMATDISGFTSDQYIALKNLISDIETRWPIQNYTGHENIAGERAFSLNLRKDIKVDPGNLFDWSRIGKVPLV